MTRTEAEAALEFLSDRYGHTVESDGEDNWARLGAIEEAMKAARLSHDRGAEAVRETANAVREHHKPNECDSCVACRKDWPCDAELLAELVLTRAALSVPAPTLPALDAETLARAMTAHAATHKVHSRSHVRASCAINIAEQYEALREIEQEARTLARTEVPTADAQAYIDWAESDVPPERTFEDWHDKPTVLLRAVLAALSRLGERE